MFGNKSKEKEKQPSIKDLKEAIFSEPIVGSDELRHMPLPSRMPTPPSPHGVDFGESHKHINKQTSPFEETEGDTDLFDVFEGLLSEPVTTGDIKSEQKKQKSHRINESTHSRVVSSNHDQKVRTPKEATSWEEVTPQTKPHPVIAEMKKEEKLRKEGKDPNDVVEKVYKQLEAKGVVTPEGVTPEESKVSSTIVEKLAEELDIPIEEVKENIQAIDQEDIHNGVKPIEVEPTTTMSRSNPMSRQNRKRHGHKKGPSEVELAIQKEKAEKERLEREHQEQLEHERQEKIHLEQERLQKERLEKERLERERQEKQRLEEERLKQERIAHEKAEQERKKQEEQERLEKQRLEQEREKEEKDIALTQKEVQQVKELDSIIKTKVSEKVQEQSKDANEDGQAGVTPTYDTSYTIVDAFDDHKESLLVAVSVLAGTPVLWYALNALKDLV